jgi:murein DD-endopeptidase MepM/ murein hydrolase activator NlpD
MRFLIPLLIACSLWAHSLSEQSWPANQTFFDYLEKHDIPFGLYYDLDDELKSAVRTIFADTPFHELRHEESGELLQALIPINEDVQISLMQVDGTYEVSLEPIRYQVVEESLTFAIEVSLLVDLQRLTGNSKIASELTAIYDDRIDFRRDFRKGDRVSVIYERKVRSGQTWGSVHVKGAFVEAGRNRHYAFFREHDQGYYDNQGKALAGMFLKYPLGFTRISSHYRPSGRHHPVLGYTRPHLGTDFAAPSGTPIRSVADGVIRFRGCQSSCERGYGRLVIVQHRNGWETRYAHLKSFNRYARHGSRVKQGQVIGYVGSSGLSTGPHLHFEVRRAGRPTNPLGIRSVKQDGLSGEELTEFTLIAGRLRADLDYVAAMAEPGVVMRLASLEPPSYSEEL